MVIPDENSTTKKRQTTAKSSSRANSLSSVKQEDNEAPVAPVVAELTEISSNKTKKMTKHKSKLLAASVNGTVDPEEKVETSASSVSVSTTTIETVDSKRTFVSKATAAKKSTSKSTLRKMASGSVGGSSGSCSESSSSSGASTASSSNDGVKEAAKKTKKKLKSLDTSSFSDSFTKFFVNKKITDYFQVRKSTRKCKSDIEKEKRQHIENAILNRKEEGLEVRNVDQKGRGIFATRAL